jgi:TPR repeat protein
VAAVPWIRSGADEGVPFAIELLGEIYDFGDGVQADPAQAKKFYERAAQLLDTTAMVMLGNMYAAGRGVTANPSTAVSWYRLAVGAGNDAGGAAGALNLGAAYLYGQGVTKDVQEGMKWVLKAAESNRMAQHLLGLYYADGDFVPKDDVQAAFWWSKASAQDDADSQFLLARAYEYAKGVQLDWGKAFYWYSRAAENGVAEASGSVCEFYRISTAGVDWRTPEATSVLQVGADRKQPSCVFLQAMRLMNGIQGPRDPERAVGLLRLSAQSNYNRAELELANAYWKGVGVQPDVTQFRYWLERAADHGNSSAIQELKDAGLR